MRPLRPHAAALCSVALLAAGCHQGVSLNLPIEPGAGYHALIEAVLTPDGQVELSAYAIDGDRPSLQPLPAQSGSSVLLLFHRRSLEQMFLSSGKVPLLEASAAGRSLYGFDLALHGVLQGDAAITLEPTSVLPGRFAELRIEAPTLSECLEHAGCYMDAAAQANADCTAPCPDPDPPDPIAAPEPAELPRIESCPLGWQTVERMGAPVACIPAARVAPLLDGSASCPTGQAQWLSASACAPIRDCAAGAFPETGAPDLRVAFVSASAPAGGNGTRATPFATLSDALASTSTVIALGPGSYTASVAPGRRLVGICPAQTRLSSAGPIVVQGPLSLEALAVNVTGGEQALRVDRGRLELNGVEVQHASEALYVASAASLSARSSAFRARMRVCGATELEQVAIEGSNGPGLRLTCDVRMVARDLLVRDLASADRDTLGITLDQGEAELERVGLYQLSSAGIGLRAAARRAQARDLYVEGGSPDRVISGPHTFVGIKLETASAELVLSRAYLFDMRAHGVQIVAGSADISDLLLESIGSVGVDAHGTTLRLDRVMSLDSGFIGVLVGVDTTGHIQDLLLDADSSAVGADNKTGLGLDAGSEVTVLRAQISRFGIGIDADGNRSIGARGPIMGTLSDLVLDKNKYHLNVYQNVLELALERVQVDGGQHGFQISGGASVQLSDWAIAHSVLGARIDDASGTIARMSISQVGSGYCGGQFSHMTADSLSISDVLAGDPQAASLGCVGSVVTAGSALYASSDGEFSVKRFHVARAETVGVDLASSKHSLESGVIEGCTVGIHRFPGSNPPMLKVRLEHNVTALQQ